MKWHSKAGGASAGWWVALAAVAAATTALSGCPPAPSPTPEEGAAPTYEVYFDSNGAEVPANPERMSVALPQTALGALPQPPSLAHHVFKGWNTARDGSGSGFEAATALSANLTVYAQWARLMAVRMDISPAPPALSPVSPVASWRVEVAGVSEAAELSALELAIEPVEGLEFEVDAHVQGGTKTFDITVTYDGDAPFPDGAAEVHLALDKLAEGYVGAAATLHAPVADGLENTRRIPLDADNIAAFNTYANTEPGLRRHYKLEEDIVLPDVSNNWVRIGTNVAPFTGSFDGGGCSIMGLRIDRPDYYQGLFGYIDGADAVIENLGLLGASVTGTNFVGALVGSSNNGGTVQQSYATGNVTGANNVGGLVGYNWNGKVQQSYATGAVNGRDYVGGLAGYNGGGTVQQSYATGNVTGANNVGGLVGVGGSAQQSYATGAVSGRDWVGGLVGAGGSAQQSYATGAVNGDRYVGGLMGDASDTVQESYATGNVNGDRSVGGLVGGSYLATIRNSYATGSVIGRESVGGLVGWSASSSIHNSVALNGRVFATTTNMAIGRVVGWTQSTNLSNNYGRIDMNILVSAQPDGSGGRLKPVENSHTGPDGESISNAHTFDLWQGRLGWNFTDIWDSFPAPILKHVGGPQKAESLQPP